MRQEPLINMDEGAQTLLDSWVPDSETVLHIWASEEDPHYTVYYAVKLVNMGLVFYRLFKVMGKWQISEDRGVKLTGGNGSYPLAVDLS